jgi:hypothetical protein
MIRATGAARTITSETVDNLQNRSPTPRPILILDSPGLPGPALAVECAEQAFSVIDATCCDQESGAEGGPVPGIDRTFHADISTVSTALHERRYVQLQYPSIVAPFSSAWVHSTDRASLDPKAGQV